MAHTFKFTERTSAGASVEHVNLVDSNHGIVAYNPDYDWSGASEITETMTIRVKSTTDSGLYGEIKNIENVLDIARDRWEKKVANPFYVEFAPDGAVSGRSPIHRGQVLAVADVLGTSWPNLELDVTMSVTRSNYWEGEANLTVVGNSNGTTYSTGLPALAKIYNSNDGSGASTATTKRNNWLTMNSSATSGDLPGTIEFSLRPVSPCKIAALHITQFYTDTAVQSSTAYPAKLGWLEGEDTSTASASTGTTYSGDAYQAYTISTGATGTDMEWSINSWFSASYHKIVFGAKFTGTVRIRPYIKVGTKKTYGPIRIFTGSNTWKIYDCGLIKIPPVYLSSYSDVAIELNKSVGLNVVCTAGTTFNIDWCQISPMTSGVYCLVDETYASYSSSVTTQAIVTPKDNKTIFYVMSGPTITGKAIGNGMVMVTPNKKNWFVFNWADESGVETPDVILLAEASYRPRWRYFYAS